MHFRVVLDACVLFSRTLTDALLYPAEVDAFAPFWSKQIEAEWTRNLHSYLAKCGKNPASVASRAAAMNEAFQDACVSDERILACMGAANQLVSDGKLNAGDVHVMATAMAVEADYIVTLNTDHFPDRVSWHQVSILRATPDDFLTRLLLDEATLVIAGYQNQLATTKSKPRSMEEIIERLSAHNMTPIAAQKLKQKLATPDLDIDLD